MRYKLITQEKFDQMASHRFSHVIHLSGIYDANTDREDNGCNYIKIAPDDKMTVRELVGLGTVTIELD